MLLDIANLNVSFADGHGGRKTVIEDLSFQLGREKLGIVGESGSGKSLTGRAILGLLPSGARLRADRMEFGGTDLLKLKPRDYRAIRALRMGMVLQDPRYYLNPVMRVGRQIQEVVRMRNPQLSRQARREAAMALLADVQIQAPDRVHELYPHEVSGGMGQRIMIAMMLAKQPDLLIADEPTSALDVRVQVQILALIQRLVAERNMSLILISHDLSLVQKFCDRVLVMLSGRCVDVRGAGELGASAHPYTRGLLNCIPTIASPLGPLPTIDPSVRMPINSAR